MALTRLSGSNDRFVLIALLASVVALGGCREVVPPTTERVATSAAVAAKVPGYLAPESRPDGIALVPPPPAPGSAGFLRDERVYAELAKLEGSARWRLAAADADLKFPAAANVFACALGIEVDQTTTPRLYTLLQRTIIDAGQSTYPAKLKYGRSRPFEETGDPTCVPDDESALRGNASYPSGHASLGYVWAAVLAEVMPDRADALRARGYEFGQSRVICRVHRQSDVDAGRTIGQAVVPRLHENAEFLADLAAAKIEAQRQRQRAAGPRRDCAAEAAALQAVTPVVPQP